MKLSRLFPELEKRRDRKLTSYKFSLNLHQVTRQFAQLATFTFHQINMGKQALVSHAVYHIDKPVGLAIQIGLVNLLDITGKHHLRTLTCAGNDSLYFMWSQVLGFINDTIGLTQATPADKRQRLNHQLFTFLHILKAFYLTGIGGELVLDYIQIIEQRLHVGSHLFIGITGQEPQVLIG